MRLALDANRYIDFTKGVDEAVRQVQRSGEVFLPLFTVAELRAGFLHGSKPSVNEATLTEFVQQNSVKVLLPDEVTTHFYARIHADLRRAGTPIPINDVWIAALVMQHELVLFTRDSHFDHVKQIARI